MLMASVLVRRGVFSKEELVFFLEKDIKNLHQPFLFKDMERAIDRILDAKSEGERVLVFGDKDVDGIVGTTIIVKALKKLGIDVRWAVPDGKQSYGVSKQVLDDFYKDHGSLVITIDCGISNHEEVKYASSLGIDFLIFDHHTPSADLPEAFAVIDAKIPEQGYPFTDLCGGALAYKLYTALLFSQSDFYRQKICLLNAVPLNEALNIELIGIRNLAVQWRKTITVSKDLPQRDEELVHLLSDSVVMVFNAELQKKLLQKNLAKSIEFYFVDIASECMELFPQFKNMTLLEMLGEKHLKQYLGTKPQEIDVLHHLYTQLIVKKESCFEESRQEVLGLAGIATVADIMPMQGENRIIVEEGIRAIRENQENKNPGLDALLARVGINKDELDVNKIGWKLAPVINASGRMGCAQKAVELLLEDDAMRIQELTEELIEFNQQRIKQMESIKREIQEKAEEALEQQKSYIMFHNEKIPHTFTGSIANALLRRHKVPAIILTDIDPQTVNGSIRCDRFFNANILIDDLREFFINGGGHKAAAGFSFPKKDEENMMRRLQSKIEELLGSDSIEKEDAIDVDLEIPEEYFNLDEVKELLYVLHPFGERWPVLNVLLRDIPIKSFERMGKDFQHVKIMLGISKYTVPALIWNYDTMLTIEQLSDASKMSFVSNLRVEVFRGMEQFSFVVRDCVLHPE